MEEQLRLQHTRKVFSRVGWALLIYLGIMNVAVMLVAMASGVFAALTADSIEGIIDKIADDSGWGYLLAIFIGTVLLLAWKKPRYLTQTVLAKGYPMPFGRFLGVLTVFVSAQLIFMVVTNLTDWASNGFAIFLSEDVTVSGDSLSLFLYACIGAPISEEILFRGLVLRTVEPYGKKFAIFSSALLFGLFHGDLIQGMFAFCVGLILAYVTLEYHILWAMLLHMLNNLLLAQTLPQLGTLLPGDWGEALVWVLVVLCSVAALIVLIARQDQIAGYLRRLKNGPNCARAFWSAPGIITLMVILGLSTLLTALVM